MNMQVHPLQQTTVGNPFQPKAMHVRKGDCSCGQDHGSSIAEILGLVQRKSSFDRKGGVTIAYTVDKAAGNVNIALAICNDVDSYDRKKGFDLAKSRLGIGNLAVTESEVKDYAFTLKIADIVPTAVAMMSRQDGLKGLNRSFISRITFEDLSNVIIENIIGHAFKQRMSELAHKHAQRVATIVGERVARHMVAKASKEAPLH